MDYFVSRDMNLVNNRGFIFVEPLDSGEEEMKGKENHLMSHKVDLGQRTSGPWAKHMV